MDGKHSGKVLAVIGASEFQVPLIRKAQELGCIVHAFAWECGDAGEQIADVFHPVSTAEREEILNICRQIGAQGVCTIGSDFNNVTAAWVANRMGLPANSDECVWRSSNKRAMREAFAAGHDPSPRSVAVGEDDDARALCSSITYPAIVKPVDRSGSRGISKIGCDAELDDALRAAWYESFCKVAVVEEYLEGNEFSVECFSWEGIHHVFQITRKYTTGAPHFIETGHIQPPLLDAQAVQSVSSVVTHALDTLGVRQGASHAEVKVDSNGKIGIVEIGSRMGGDFIGSDLVELSTGIDYVGAVVDAALGVTPSLHACGPTRAAAVRFVLNEEDAAQLTRLRAEHPEFVVRGEWSIPKGRQVVDSSTRFGYCLMCADSTESLIHWMPQVEGEVIG